MYGVEILTPPAVPPIAAAELRARLRINDSAEDPDLTEFLAAAVELFEHDTGRPVLTTTYRQDLARWPCGPIVLGRGGVTAVVEVGSYAADGSAEELATDQWAGVLTTPPARIHLAAKPEVAITAAGIAVSPVGYVIFTAGWANAAAVPKQVRIALMLLAGHWYENREAYRDSDLRETPEGWRRVVDRFRLGISGDWGQ